MPGKSEISPENLKLNFFRMKSKISVTGSTTPQTSNQIDVAAIIIEVSFNIALLTRKQARPEPGRGPGRHQGNSVMSVNGWTGQPEA